MNQPTALTSSMMMETTAGLAFLVQEYIKDELFIQGQYRIKWLKIYQNIMICKSWSIKAIRKLTDSKLVGRNKIRILITKLKWIRWAAHNSRPSQSDSHMILSMIGKQLGNLALVQRTKAERYLAYGTDLNSQWWKLESHWLSQDKRTLASFLKMLSRQAK